MQWRIQGREGERKGEKEKEKERHKERETIRIMNTSAIWQQCDSPSLNSLTFSINTP